MSAGSRAGSTSTRCPDSAVLGIDLRPVPGQTSAQVLAELARLWPEAELELLVDCPPLWSDPGAPTGWPRRRARRGDHRAWPAAPAPVPFATDAGYLTPAYGDPPTVILGPGETEQAHKTDEWCSLTRIEQAVELYAELASAWCAGRGLRAPIGSIADRHWPHSGGMEFSATGRTGDPVMLRLLLAGCSWSRARPWRPPSPPPSYGHSI